MSVKQLLTKGDVIVSARTGKELLCYTEPMRGYVGDNIVSLEYCFYDDVKKKFKSYNGHKLKTMLEGVWFIKHSTI